LDIIGGNNHWVKSLGQQQQAQHRGMEKEERKSSSVEKENIM
jgi:hypothetical protein